MWMAIINDTGNNSTMFWTLLKILSLYCSPYYLFNHVSLCLLLESLGFSGSH